MGCNQTAGKWDGPLGFLRLARYYTVKVKNWSNWNCRGVANKMGYKHLTAESAEFAEKIKGKSLRTLRTLR